MLTAQSWTLLSNVVVSGSTRSNVVVLIQLPGTGTHLSSATVA